MPCIAPANDIRMVDCPLCLGVGQNLFSGFDACDGCDGTGRVPEEAPDQIIQRETSRIAILESAMGRTQAACTQARGKRRELLFEEAHYLDRRIRDHQSKLARCLDEYGDDLLLEDEPND